ncbi:MAG: hypothetical protein U0640_15655 [Phycisphaerales bacterium]
MSDARQHTPRGSPLFATFGDAAFLACSWTWCIGMFLPVLLLRDMGLGSFLVFALPNCIGAAAFAWWMRDAETSRAFVRVHARQIRWFSYVTIAFQWFFGAWMLRGLGLSPWTLGVIAAGAGVFFLLPQSLMDDKRRRLVSVLVWAISVALLVGWAVMNPADATLKDLPAPALTGNGHLGPLLGVCMFGFMLCPLMDGTFHLVMQRTARPKATFGLGFLILFAAMIVGTLFYGAFMVKETATGGWTLAPFNAPKLVLIHIAIQLAYTLAVHERAALSIRGWNDAGARPNSTFIASIAGILLAIVAPMILITIPKVDLSMSEVVYRGFMVFYGLVFPVYVVGCVLPLKNKDRGFTSKRGLALVGVCLLAMPFYCMGFILREREYLYYGFCIAVILGSMSRIFPGPRLANAAPPLQSGE